MRSLLTLVFGVLTTLSLTQCQLTIPSKELGYVYGTGQPDALVKIAAYIDFTCPYSKAAYTTLLQVANDFPSSEVQFKVHAFSVPYHRHSHTISKAANVLNDFKSPKSATVFDWITAAYDNIASLTTTATKDQSDTEIVNFLASLAQNVSGISTADFISGVYDTNVDSLTRLGWKYGVTRGVYGVPSITVNDVFTDADSSWTVSQWKNLIDGLLSKQ
ncbi:unnamed protein product [Candidula unifasciata]|uniref:Thioredoxin-like fold domain-containing protein n=1 Tax=Candidula unifasciata TaxID=100452 RepID=A0A8S3ZFM0_9EUPU|nr:unnamed protein product [Candidula unifasciata]